MAELRCDKYCPLYIFFVFLCGIVSCLIVWFVEPSIKESDKVSISSFWIFGTIVFGIISSLSIVIIILIFYSVWVEVKKCRDRYKYQAIT